MHAGSTNESSHFAPVVIFILPDTNKRLGFKFRNKTNFTVVDLKVQLMSVMPSSGMMCVLQYHTYDWLTPTKAWTSVLRSLSPASAPRCSHSWWSFTSPISLPILYSNENCLGWRAKRWIVRGCRWLDKSGVRAAPVDKLWRKANRDVWRIHN